MRDMPKIVEARNKALNSGVIDNRRYIHIIDVGTFV